MTVNQAIEYGLKKLKTAGDKSAVLDAEILLALVLKKEKEFLYTYPGTKITNRQFNKFKKIISRRAKGEPVAYIIKSKEFYGFDFYVDKNVLIPRPATELLVDEALDYIKKTSAKNLTVCDVGVGSGAIIVSLAKSIKPRPAKQNFKFIGVDVLAGALTVAQKNAQNHHVKIQFIKSDLLKSVTDKKIDILAANLPYLKNREIKGALKYEPRTALAGGKSGLEPFKKLFKQISNLKNLPKIIFLEIGDRQKNALEKLAKKLLPRYKTKTKKDLGGLDRLLILNLITKTDNNFYPAQSQSKLNRD